MHSEQPSDGDIQRELAAWITSTGFTCLGARAAVKQRILVTRVFGAMCARDDTAALHTDIRDFVIATLSSERDFHSFAAVFRSPVDVDEARFEALLWEQLGALHALDSRWYAWAEGYDSDPDSGQFGFSLIGHPFFVAGLNPASSRISRRFRYPVLVFNSHRQFERLKRTGTYQRLKDRIRVKEQQLQGSINPMLADHGKSSEARQYSGRAVEDDWKCPFRPGQDR